MLGTEGGSKSDYSDLYGGTSGVGRCGSFGCEGFMPQDDVDFSLRVAFPPTAGSSAAEHAKFKDTLT